MEDYAVFLDRLLTETITRLAFHATEVQTRIDSFIAVQAPGLTTEQLENLVLRESTTVRAEIDAAKNAIFATLRGAVTETAQSSLTQYQIANGTPEDEYVWQIESGRPCPDCVGRSGQGAHSMDYWIAIGLPQAGATRCGSNCKCILVKVSE
jgi:hypothetical protein